MEPVHRDAADAIAGRAAFEPMLFPLLRNVSVDTAHAVKRLVLGPYRVRRAQVYGVGIGKSGTHSIARMFSRRVRARHEPQALQLMDKVIQWSNGRISDREMIDWLRARDRALALEVDSSGINLQIATLLAREFPNARFILAIRDCYSWTNSRLNGDMNMSRSHPWHKWMEFVYGDGRFVHAPEEQALKDRGIRPLDSFLSSWAKRNSEVLAGVLPTRLFVVRTDQIRQRAFEIADFAGLPRRFIRLDRTHEYRNARKQPLLLELDPGFVERKVDEHCRPLMTRFFPDIKSIADAKL